MLAAIYDIGTSVLEVPSGYFSDRIGRRITLIIACIASVAGCVLLAGSANFYLFALAQVLIGAGSAFASGTDSALLYDSLKQVGRENEIAEQEARAWRFRFTSLAISAFLGGLIAMVSMPLVYASTAAVGCIAIALATMFREPERDEGEGRDIAMRRHARDIWKRIGHRPLTWLFVLVVSMYVFSHVPFVFGQPVMKNALEQIGFAGETPLVSGTIISMMMLTSVAAGWVALPLARRIGDVGSLLLSLGIQIALIAIIAVVVHPLAILVLLIRMVPDALAKPIIMAAIQPRLQSSYRATYLSVQNLVARFGLAGTLLVTSLVAPTSAALEGGILFVILMGYAVLGGIIWVLLWSKRGWLTDSVEVEH